MKLKELASKVAMKEEEDEEAAPKRKRAHMLLTMTFVRWLIILGCFAFVFWGWINSAEKYLSGQTSVSITVNESSMFTFPSVTFCKAFKVVNIVKAIVDESYVLNVTRVDQLDLNAIVDAISYKRTDYLSLFSHPINGNPWDGLFVLTNDSYWTTTIPHSELSGTCYTYDPPFQSFPSMWFGIRLGFKFPNTQNFTQAQKESLLRTVNIYLHKKGDFMFYLQDDRPSSGKLDVSWLRYQNEVPVNLKYHSFTRLPRTDRPCIEDLEGYNFNKCVEKHYAKIRGCQYPWYYFEEFGIPPCNNITELAEKVRLGDTGTPEEQDWSRPYDSTSSLAQVTDCPVPCTSGTFSTELSYNDINSWMTWKDNDSEWIVYLYFKNMQFEYDEEFVVCDWTCLIGELGGNLGFFLGGSILAYVDFLLNPLFNIFHRRKP